MRRAAVAALLASALAGALPAAASAGAARRALDDGLELWAARRYEEAAARFAAAAAEAGEDGLDPDVARYDHALALLGADKVAEAAEAFARVQGADDLRLRESAHYHRGIALEKAADAAVSAGEAGRAIALLEEALSAYEGAMRIDPRDEDPKVNHELAARKKARLEQGRQKAGAAGEPRERGQSEPPPGQPARQTPPGKELLPEEARTLLDAMRQQEQAQRGRTRPNRGGAIPVEKNW